MKKTLIFKDCGLAVELTIDERWVCTDAVDVSDKYDQTFRDMIASYVGHSLTSILITAEVVMPLYIAWKYGREIIEKQEKERFNLMAN